MKNNISESNYNNSQYSYNFRGYNSYNSYTSVPRNWLIFAQVLGTVFSVIGLIVFIYYMQTIYNSLSSDNLTKKSLVALILSVIVYFVWRSIYTAIVIIRLASKSSDIELCANRYIISALSLGVGGFFTPFLITSFPNVDTTSTIKPRYFLSKTMGLCILIGAPILTFVYFLTLFTGANPVTNINLIFASDSTMATISILVLTITSLAFVFGLATTNLFFSNKTLTAFDKKNYSKMLQVISTIWMAILTVELVIVILFSIVRLLSALADLFRTGEQSGGIMMLFALLNFFITISYVGMVIHVTTRTISGLWSLDGTIKIKKYQHNKFTQNRLNNNMNV